MAKPYSPAEPVSDVRRIPIRECGEPLVDFLEHCPRLILSPPIFDYRRATLVRKKVAEMLKIASESLPSENRLVIVEGWRSIHIQRRLYLATWNRLRERYPHLSETALRRKANQFTAPIHRNVPPPHSTGGAIDVVLGDQDGRRLDHTSPFDWLDPVCYIMDADGLSDVARAHRDILSAALIGAGLTNYPSEYWHWSYGDQGWAYRTGQSAAIYGPIEPDDWHPSPEELVADPVSRIGDLADVGTRQASNSIS